MTCPHCHHPIRTRDVLAEAGRIRAGARSVFAGTPKKIRRCPHCRAKFGARELRAHQPHCEKRE